MMGAGAHETPTLSSDGTVHAWWGWSSDKNFLHAINADGTTKWIFNASTAGLNMHLTHREGPNGTIYVTGECNYMARGLPCPARLLALDGSDGSVQWTYQSLTETDDRYNHEYYKPHDLQVAKDGTLYLSSETAEHYSGLIVVEVIDANGMLKWSFDNLPRFGNAGYKRFWISPDNGILIQNINTVHGTVETLDIQSLSLVDGSVKWTLPFLSYWSTIMTFAEDGSIFLIQDHTIDFDSSSFEKSLLRLNGEDGRVLWNTSMSVSPPPHIYNPHIPRQQFFFVGNEEVYVNGLLGKGGVCNLGIFNIESGSQRDLPCFTHVQDMSRHATDLAFLPKLEQNGAAEDTFVVTNQHYHGPDDADASVLAFSGVDGNGLWNVSIGRETGPSLRLRLVVRQDNIFAISGYRLHCIRHGDELWDMTMGFEHVGDPIVAEDGTTFVFFGGELFAITSDGVEKWRYPTSPEVEMFMV